MIERVVKPGLRNVSKALDAEEFVESNPLNFQFYYADRYGRAEMINTVYLEDGNPKLDLYLEVFNDSSGSIEFTTSPGTSYASEDQCHFSIRWEKDLKIKPAEIELEQADKWQVNYDENSHFFTLYFLSKQRFVLESKNIENDSDRILLKLKNFTANNRDVKTSNVELLYGSPLLLNSEGEGFTDIISCKNAISVTNHPDDKNIPLQFRFIGPNTILNDGTTQNSLKLQIINRPSSNNTRPNLLLDKANSKFIVDFEIGSGAEALIPQTQANKIKVATSNSDWKVPATQNGTAVTVDLKPDSKKDKLVSGEAIELDITGIVTSNPSGVSFLYITYQNIGNYPDGRLVVPVEKTPLLYRGAQVGIGTTNPSAKLHVSGGDAFIGGKLTSTGDALISGKVGIGTTSPSAKLEVKLADTTTTDSSLKLEHNGSNFTVSPHRGGGNNSTIIQNTGGGSLIINPSSGNVGIGTTTPSATLHVNGRIKDKTGWVMPVGSILPYAGATAPEGWLLCDGASCSQSQYKDLHDVIQYQYGGSGNNFNLPKLQGRVPAGLSTEVEFKTLGQTGGSKTHTLNINEMPSHSHSVIDPGHIHTGGAKYPGSGAEQNQSGKPEDYTSFNINTGKSTTGISIQPNGYNQAHNNLQPYITVNYIIKY